MNYDASADIENRQGGGLGGAARRQAAHLFQEHISAAIQRNCDAIERERVTGVRPETRKAFGNLLANHGITNPGGLTQRQENICAWVLLEYTERNPTYQLPFGQLKSFTPTAKQADAAIKISGLLGLDK